MKSQVDEGRGRGRLREGGGGGGEGTSRGKWGRREGRGLGVGALRRREEAGNGFLIEESCAAPRPSRSIPSSGSLHWTKRVGAIYEFYEVTKKGSIRQPSTTRRTATRAVSVLLINKIEPPPTLQTPVPHPPVPHPPVPHLPRHHPPRPHPPPPHRWAANRHLYLKRFMRKPSASCINPSFVSIHRSTPGYP